MSDDLTRVAAALKASVGDVLDTHLKGVANSRLDRAWKLGAWNAGRCPRQLWLGKNSAKMEPVQPRSLMVFETGHSTEEWILRMIVESGAKVRRSDPEVDKKPFPYEGIAGTGNVLCDCFVELDGIGTIIADVKSLSNKSYEYTLRDGVSDEYKIQMLMYCEAYDVPYAALFIVRKETSHVVLGSLAKLVVKRDRAFLDAHMAKLASVLEKDAPPAIPYPIAYLCEGAATGACVNGLTPARKQPHSACKGTGVIPGGPYMQTFPCGYCDVKIECYSRAGFKVEEVLEEGEKPRWRLTC